MLVAAALRRLGLLTAVHRVASFLDSVRNYSANRRFRSDHPDYVLPPAKLRFVTAPTTNAETYRSGGLQHARWLHDVACEHLDTAPTLSLIHI